MDLALIGVVVAGMYWRQIFTSAFFGIQGNFTDWTFLAHPTAVFTGNALLRGEFPLWNFNWFAGYPHLAVPSNAVLYPFTLVYGIFGYPVATKIFVLVHVYLFAAGSYLVGRNVCRTRTAAWFLVVAAVFGSVQLWPLAVGNVWTVATIAWLPVALLAMRKLLSSGKTSWFVLLSVVVALMVFAGDPPTMAFIMLFLAIIAATQSIWDWSTTPGQRRRIAIQATLVLSSVLLGMALGAIQLLPSQEFIGQSIRKNGITYDYFHGPFPQTLFGSYWSAVFKLMAPLGPTAGKLSFAVAAAAFFAGARRTVAGFAFGVAVLVSFGSISENFYYSVITHIPVFGGVRGVTPYAIVSMFGLAMLSALGIDALLERRDDGRFRWQPWLAVTLLSATMLISSSYFDRQFHFRVLSIPVFAAIMAFSLWRKPRPIVVALALLSVLVAEHLVRMRNEPIPGPFPVEIAADIQQFHDRRTDSDRILTLGPYRNLRQGAAVSLLTGDRNATGYHAVLLDRYARLLRDVGGANIAVTDALGRLDNEGEYLAGDWISAQFMPVLDLLNVRYVLRNGGPSYYLRSQITPKSPNFAFEMLGQLRIYTIKNALPPVFAVHDIVPVQNDDEAIAALRSDGFDHRRRATVLVNGTAPIVSPANRPESIAQIRRESNAVEARVSLSAPALVVHSEMWYPGWYAQVDGGAAQPTLCANLALQATPVPAGDHTVRFFYRPRSVIVGATVSGLAALVWLALLVVLIVRRKPSASAKV